MKLGRGHFEWCMSRVVKGNRAYMLFHLFMYKMFKNK